MKLPKAILNVYFSEFIILCGVALILFGMSTYSFLTGDFSLEDYVWGLGVAFFGTISFYYCFVLANNIMAVLKLKKDFEYLEILKNKPQFFRWFILTWPIVASILFINWFWIWPFYAFFIFSGIYLTFLLLKKLSYLTDTTPTKMIIIIIMHVATLATAYMWYKAERWSSIIQSSDGRDSMASIYMIYSTAFQRIIIIWIITGFWSLFLGLKNRIK